MGMSITTSLQQMDALVYFQNNNLHWLNAYHVPGSYRAYCCIQSWRQAFDTEIIDSKTQSGFPKIMLEISGRVKIWTQLYLVL